MLKNAADWIDMCQSANHFFLPFLLRLQMKAAVSQYFGSPRQQFHGHRCLTSVEVVTQFGPPAGLVRQPAYVHQKTSSGGIRFSCLCFWRRMKALRPCDLKGCAHGWAVTNFQETCLPSVARANSFMPPSRSKGYWLATHRIETCSLGRC
jgi:hypothetical protein